MVLQVKVCRKGKACGRACIRKKNANGKRTRCNKPMYPYVVNYFPGINRPGIRPQAPPTGSHVINLNIHIIHGCKVTTPVCKATSHVTCADIEEFIIPLINDFYIPTGIFFKIKRCQKTRAEQNKLTYQFDDDMRIVERLFDQTPLYDKGSINIFFVPIIPENAHGYQVTQNNSFIVMSESDPNNCREEPRTRMATTLAHEIGHDLGLSIGNEDHHPDPNNLMYGNSPADGGPGGHDLDANQINRLKRNAKLKYPTANRRSQLILLPKDSNAKVYKN